MRVSSFSHVLFVAAGVVAVDPNFCPSDYFLVFNNTNADLLAQCSQFNYTCRSTSITQFNSTTGPPPASSEFSWNVQVDKSINGSLSIPLLASAGQALFLGQRDYSGRCSNETIPEAPLNLTSLKLPDLVYTTSFFGINTVQNFQRLSSPKLESVRSGISSLSLNLSGDNPPPINLSFPSLTHAYNGISLMGNIDAVDLPVLNSTSNINITSTGNLDCAALATKLVNTTSSYYQDNYNIGTYGPTDNSFVCNSKKGNVVTYHKKASGGSAVEVKWGTIGPMWFLGFIGFLL